MSAGPACSWFPGGVLAAQQSLGEGDACVEIVLDHGTDAAGRAGGFFAQSSFYLVALFDQARAGILDG